MGRIEKVPDWILKYKDDIERKAITVEEILEAENKIRDKPIKLSTVMRALNSLGFRASDLPRRSASPETAYVTDAAGESTGNRGPAWLQKYRDRIEAGTITVEEILEAENKIRDKPIKLSTVTRAINAMGFPTSGLRKGAVKTVSSEVTRKEAQETATAGEDTVPYWLQKYRDRIEAGTITVEEILEEENKIREEHLKLSTLVRALDSLASAQKIKVPTVEIRTQDKGEFGASIDSIAESTRRRFDDIKEDWEKDLGRKINNDYFMNILLALAKLLGHGKTLTVSR